jgi:hypothetical protein
MAGSPFQLPVPPGDDAIKRNQRHDGKNSAQQPMMPAAAIKIRVIVRVISKEPAMPIPVPEGCRDHTDHGGDSDNQKNQHKEHGNLVFWLEG